MAYNTLNPVGSSDFKDLSDNAVNFDKYANGADPAYPNRFGEQKLSIEGMNQAFNNAQDGRDAAFQNFLVSSGYQDVGDYGAGLTLTARNQVFNRDNVTYRVAATTTLPYTLTGNWASESNKFVVVGDDSLRQDLAAADGAASVGYGSETVKDALDAVQGIGALVGEANPLAFGPVKRNGADYAIQGSSITPTLSGFSKSNFDSSGSHTAGTVGTMAATVVGTADPIYLLTISVSTTSSGRIKIKTNGADIFEDQPNGYFFSTAAVQTTGIENNRPIDSTTFMFVVRTFNDPITSVTIETDTAWGGTVASINLAVITPTKFAVGGMGSSNGEKNPMGLKVGAYNRNDMAVGDTLTLGCFQYDGAAQTPAHNVAIGAQAQASNVDGDENTAVGSYALKYNETSNNTAVGYGAAKLSTKGRELVALGYKAAFTNSIGSRNTSVGFWANGRNNDGNHNAALGWYAGIFAGSGSYNVYLGSQSGTGNKDGSSNVFIGALAGYADNNGATSYNSQTVVGSESWGWGAGITLLGYRAKAGTNAVEASNATAIGNGATAGGPSTVSVGYQAGQGDVGNLNTNIGPLAGAYGSNTAFVNSTCLGYGANVSGSSQVQLGNSTTTTYVYGTVQNRSDLRDKADVVDSSLGLEFILGLRAVEGRWNMRDDYVALEEYQDFEEVYEPSEVDVDGKPTAHTVRRVAVTKIKTVQLPNDGSKKRKRLHQWFIAQEVKTLCDKLGVDFGGYQDHSVTGGEDKLSLGYDEFIPPVVKAIQELSARIESIEARLAKLES